MIAAPTVDEVMAILRTSPVRLSAVASGLSEARLIEPLEAGGWSMQDIVAHLRACDAQWGRELRLVVAGRPRFRSESPRGTIRRTDFPATVVGPALDAFRASRVDLLSVLDTLTPDGWSMASTITGSGRGEDWSVLRLATRLTDHERDHVEHLERATVMWRT